MNGRTKACEAAACIAVLEAKLALMREALKRIAAGEADGLDGARDTVVLERVIGLARRTLREVEGK
jgi:hypothetical protein